MYRVITASSDTYITNKIINNRYRATDANTGQAGTLDLFKLYGESTHPTSGSEGLIELSRILVKFDHNKIKSMNDNGLIDITDSSFKATLKLHDVYGGETTPNNFKCIVFPLAKKFDEGIGRDIGNYSDLDVTNYLTASYESGTVFPWHLPGGMLSGSLTDVGNIDVIVSGTIPGKSSEESLCVEQLFNTGEEDLSVDITSFVSASVKGLIANHGHMIAFSGSYEKDANSYFVKRFSSRNTPNTAKRPKLIILYNDAVLDNHENFIFNTSGSLYLSNHVRGALSNLRTGDSPSDIATGKDCMILKIVTGSFRKVFNVSQAQVGQNRLTGVYSSSFAISSYGTLFNHVKASGSVTFDEVWSNSDETLSYLSSSLTIKDSTLAQFDLKQTSYHVTVLNLADRYKNSEVAKIRVFVEDNKREIKLRKTPFEKKSQVFEQMYYRVRDFISGEIVIPFETSSNATRLSSDSQGMYFDFYMDSLPSGRTFVFEFLIKQSNFDNIISDAPTKFIVE